MRNLVIKFVLLILVSAGLGFLSFSTGMNFHQSMSIAIFSVSILGTLFFWSFRLSFAFLGTSLLMITKTIDLEHLVRFASLEVILFLIGMMVIIGLLKDEGFFAWIVSLILRIRNLNAKKFVFSITIISALLACVVDEVTSIIFMVAAILEICDYFEVEPLPYIIISVLATNIGSAATVLGNPIGILIASKAGLTFEDFITKAFPIAVICLVSTIFIVMFWYRKTLEKLDAHIKEFGSNDILIKLISVPPGKQLKISLTIFAVTIFIISLHHRLELLWHLDINTVLLATPLLSSGLIMIWKRNKARDYIEKDVEWWTLLFFLLLFAQAGTLKYTGATDVLAKNIIGFTGNNPHFVTGAILWMSAIGSSILDNVVLVAAFIPIVQGFQALSINLKPLWWALLFGGCFGGNITVVGSTANIVALGILEKEKKVHVSFLEWFWIGLTVGVVTTCITWLILVTVPFYQ
ncbi:MAG: SLC13 family permease [Candidatus Omnitrophota bacterium]